MKILKRVSNLPWICGGLGAIGMGLRFWLLKTGFDEKGLLQRGHPASWLLLLLTVVAVAAVVAALWDKQNIQKRAAMFPPSLIGAAAALVGGFGIAWSAFCVYTVQQTLLIRITWILGFGAAIASVILAWYRLKGMRPCFLLRAALTLYLMAYLLYHYEKWFSQTQTELFATQLLAHVLLVLAFFHRTALEANQGGRKNYILTSQLAGFFCLMAIPGAAQPVFYGAMAVWLLADLGKPELRSQKSEEVKLSLPDYVTACMDKLEAAGFEAWAVGGCVRDMVRWMTPHDYDLCTNALPEQIKQVFAAERLVLSGEKHGTVAVVTEQGLVEITTFRTEGGYQDSRHPDWVKFVKNIEEDLSRRDFTVNAMAYSPTRGFADPFGGRKDLKNRCLRAVGDPEKRFQEDALRILRGVRFAIRYRLTPEKKTLKAMTDQVGLLDQLAKERIFEELCKLLPRAKAADLIRYQKILVQVIPQLEPAVNFDQRSPHHAYDVFTHIAYVVENTPPQLPLRWAALLHDIGKPETCYLDETGRGHFPDHAKAGARMANEVLLQLKAPTALREQVTALIERHMVPLEPDKKLLRRRLARYGVQGVEDLYALQLADFSSKGVIRKRDEEEHFRQVRLILDEILREDACLQLKDLAVKGADLMELGMEPGPKLGAVLSKLLEQVVDEELPNEKQALLEAAKGLAEE